MVPLFLLKFVARRRKVKRIFLGDFEYLQRFFLFKAFGKYYYLHRMLGPDGDRDLHNHPWTQMHSYVLHGSYIERRLEFGFKAKTIQFIPGHVINTVRKFFYLQTNRWFNKMGEHTWHSIIQIETPETWTLFVHNEWSRTWGFLRKTGYEPSDKFKDKDGKPDPDVAFTSKWWEKDDTPKGKDLKNL